VRRSDEAVLPAWSVPFSLPPESGLLAGIAYSMVIVSTLDRICAFCSAMLTGLYESFTVVGDVLPFRPMRGGLAPMFWPGMGIADMEGGGLSFLLLILVVPWEREETLLVAMEEENEPIDESSGMFVDEMELCDLRLLVVAVASALCLAEILEGL